VDLSPLAERFQRYFERKTEARERALPAARRAVRSSANAIRAIHRGDLDRAHALMQEASSALRAGREAVAAEHRDVYHAGFLHDAQKEYAEARLTEALVTGSALPDPDELEVEPAAYLNGMAEAIGEGRRAILDLLRLGEVERGERILRDVEEMYSVLVSIDFPDAITGNLRRSTDAARGIMEKTRGDLTLSLVQRDLARAIDRHARLLAAGPGPSTGDRDDA
jgi:translin